MNGDCKPILDEKKGCAKTSAPFRYAKGGHSKASDSLFKALAHTEPAPVRRTA